ncbi:zinc-dependent peptidase [Reichenbachiella versicolor]|uniref:zinc-dependent peptidase n=1 Tax=Reichenbachiella versicolor TaxID=1821036 RepID=UPI001C886011|nr:zinc-dependent peptidase [Reichenbachiella versicolor]
MTIHLIVILTLALGIYWLILQSRKNRLQTKRSTEVTTVPTPLKWITILNARVTFYQNLSDDKKVQFESDVKNFLAHIKITGVQTNVDLEDRLLVASSAVIPLFGYPAWTYTHLDEVILYPDSFDRNFKIGSKEEIITGMVGNGPMEGKVILSKPSLHLGFDINSDKKNVGIHEFVHLFDKETGNIDGIPPVYENKAYSLPWLEFIQEKTKEIHDNKSDINDYGATNKQEFFAVASEYFFERPHLLEKKHPKLYEELEQIFKQDMTNTINKSSFEAKKVIGRNDDCPCGSGKKYKKCCMK